MEKLHFLIINGLFQPLSKASCRDFLLKGRYRLRTFSSKTQMASFDAKVTVRTVDAKVPLAAFDDLLDHG
ncbi:hypothetical protein DN052_04830 [Acidithiobacillus ferrooxidans]|uniref:Uncharacterized protein n=1 Tax=Acidithiobacillus ferrooxidans TaxID=920 RepID=A0A2W1K5X8_ACIFR|nr:hypothetical protein DN052_04830 [Acidithiobacillus ferrooxidans]